MNTEDKNSVSGAGDCSTFRIPKDIQLTLAEIREPKRRQLAHSARQMFEARWAKYNDPHNEEWDFDDVTDKWERHAWSAFLDLVAVEKERDTLLSIISTLQETESSKASYNPELSQGSPASSPKCTCFASPSQEHSTYCPREGMDFDSESESVHPDVQAADVALIIPTCGKCPFVDHSGAFTPGGARPICSHKNAVETFARGVTAVVDGFEDRYHWRHRIVDRDAPPPLQCPIRLAASPVQADEVSKAQKEDQG